MSKILVKNAVERKPGHIYYIDRWGNIIEEKSNKLTLLEKLKCKWIDFIRWLDDN